MTFKGIFFYLMKSNFPIINQEFINWATHIYLCRISTVLRRKNDITYSYCSLNTKASKILKGILPFIQLFKGKNLNSGTIISLINIGNVQGKVSNLGPNKNVITKRNEKQHSTCCGILRCRFFWVYTVHNEALIRTVCNT